jgi:hypothetical protein
LNIVSSDYIILAGDSAGFITGIRYGSDSKAQVATFGANNDSRINKGIKKIFSPDNITLYTLGFEGYLRTWSIQ